MNNFRFKAYIPRQDMIVDIVRINFDVSTIEVNLIVDDYLHNDLHEYNFNEIEVLQSSGFTINNEEIYEGYILDAKFLVGSTEDFDEYEEHVIDEVIFSKHRAMFMFAGVELQELYDVKILGNIFQNYNLLKNN